MTEPIRLTREDAQASQALIDAYAESWQRINDAQLALVDDPTNARKRARLNELQDMVSREIATLDASARRYVAEQFPLVYAGAAARAAVVVAADSTAFVQPNREATQRLAEGLERQLLDATRHVDATTKKLIRQVGRDAALKTALDGKTATQAATEMRRILERSGVHAVTYANGAKVGLKGYAEMAIRTSTALALNEGAVQGAEDAGCEFWEVFDGPTCGFTRHNDPDRAHGKIVTREEALANPIAHPNCRRALGPRPDLGTTRAKKPATQSATVEDIGARAGATVPPRAVRALDRVARARARALAAIRRRRR